MKTENRLTKVQPSQKLSLVTNKTMQTSTKHRNIKHFGWISQFYVLQPNEESPIQKESPTSNTSTNFSLEI